MKGFRQPKKPTRRDLEDENEAYRQALEDIADILEDVGIIDTGETFPDGDLGEHDGD